MPNPGIKRMKEARKLERAAAAAVKRAAVEAERLKKAPQLAAAAAKREAAVAKRKEAADAYKDKRPPARSAAVEAVNNGKLQT